ncbi:hypothetical protein GCK32_002481, partial [Trichostrongylus colubriformis]
SSQPHRFCLELARRIANKEELRKVFTCILYNAGNLPNWSEGSCLVNSCQSFGVYERHCCGATLNECCGSVTIVGWIVAGALVVLIIVAVFCLVCRK